MTIRTLFFPWSAGGGAGYTGRGLAAADRLDERFSCAFGPSAVTRMVAEAGYSVVGTPSPGGPPQKVPAFLPFTDVERVFAATARYYRKSVLADHLARDLAAIDAYRPHIVVTDMQPTAVLAARLRGLPVVSLADTDFLYDTPHPWMPWNTADPKKLLPHPDAIEAIGELASEHGLAPVRHVRDLLWGDRTVVPSSPEVEPAPIAPDGRSEAVFVGPLYWDPPGPPFQPERKAGTHHVYVTIGSGGMVTERALREVLKALDRPDFTVFLSAGFAASDWVREHRNVQVGGFTGITGPIGWADLVLSHGGYSTVLASLEQGRPQVVLPFMSEQEANGRYFVERHGAGLVARTTEVDPVDGTLTYVNRHGGRTSDPVVPAVEIARTVDEVLGDGGFAERAGYAREALARDRAAGDLSEVFASVLR
ncbi:glycosyl transferase [Streptomyces sp. F63]|uniref:glycosyltransferase n=1 Tax=Streptomyces sp. F63 TaxID=2824887 RepID=UPI001B36CD16|nr:glycosyltransferase [Streptomyces sp. F63]MBQ0983220.1 glycosyl transferase [Streptomyces sp. F63]